MRPTFRSTGRLPASFTAAGRTCASCRSWCLGSVAGGCSRHWASSLKSAISTKGMRRSRSWNGRDVSCRRPGSPSMSDMRLTEQLVQGADVWLNTPRRPWEASGTSGMKVLVNGGINLSELDGWWAEAYTPEVGWALGDGQEHGDDPAWDAAEADTLYDLLEREVIPEFSARDQSGIPTAWVAR